LHSFFTSELDEAKWSAPHPSHFACEKRDPWYLLNRKVAIK